MARASVLPTVLTGVFVTILDFFIVNVAIPSLQQDLRAGPTAVEWVVAGYGLAYGAGLILGGRLGDLYGRRRMFVVGLALFTAASLACGLAPDAGALVAARVAQGLAAALLSPQVLAIIRTAYSGPAQARAVGAYALTMGLAAVFGQLIGGALIRADLLGGGWRLCFLINVPIGLLVVARARRVLPEGRGGAVTRLDPAGTVLLTAALLATLVPLIEGREQGWPWWTWVSFAASVLLLAGYAVRRHEAPVVDTALFRERAFTVGLSANLVFTMGMAAYFLVLALYTQQARGLDPLGAGLLFTPIGVGYLAASRAAPRLAARHGRQVVAVGALVRALALTGLLLAVTHEAPLGWLVPALLADGAGMGLALAPLMGTVLAGVSPRHAGAAAGVLTTAQQVGGALGVGIVGVVFYGAVDQGVTEAFRHSLVYLIAVAATLGGLVQLLPSARAVARAAAGHPVPAAAAPQPAPEQ
ncbi:MULTISPECIES: MFS transporter [Streptomyces]|uniref:MFS transporter n=2 Tax=Streptomyces TaxID=1883 RepID=A0A2U9PDQ7_STRAS|nr:MFS transporter [Streptomyces actuosus]AWT47084.1 MFS transporter [Streptomyces actuosus]MBM4823731.1 MFS transporter [Streptomyces actuosus]